MDDNTIEIRDEEINVEEIMATIRENIRRRKAAGELLPDPDALLMTVSSCQTPTDYTEGFHRDLEYINSNWDITNNSYDIVSHRPVIGRILVKGRQIINGEVRRYVDPVITYQTEFNGSIVRLLIWTSQRYNEQCLQFSELNQKYSNITEQLNGLFHKNDEIDKRYSEQCLQFSELNKKYYNVTEQLNGIIHKNDEIDKRQIGMEHAFSLHKQESDKKLYDSVLSVKNELDLKIIIKTKEQIKNLELVRTEFNGLLEKEAEHLKREILTETTENSKNFIKDLFSVLDEDIHTRAWIAHVLEERIQKEISHKPAHSVFDETTKTSYFLFEDRFRGAREEISRRQQVFLPYFERSSHVLDIGCGRGEFLEILKKNNIGGTGIDIDQDMVAFCRSRQLDAEHVDAITYLETLEDNSLDGIFIDQVVEHLEPDYLIRLIALCYRKLKYGYYIIVETVNPLSFVSFVNFYIDMTHKKPVHPETLQYLFSAAGFHEREKRFFSPVPDESRLKKITTAVMNDTEQKIIGVYNQNIEILNSMLFGAQDYAIVAKK